MCNLLIRRYPRRRPDWFRSVRDLGRVPVRCSCQSGIPEGRSPRWLPAWLPVAEGLADRLACCGPSAFQAGHIPSWHGSCESAALSLIAVACRWSLLLLSPLLSGGSGSLLVRRVGIVQVVDVCRQVSWLWPAGQGHGV